MAGTSPTPGDLLTRVLDGVVRMTGEADPEVVLRHVLATACEAVDARYGALGLVDDRGELHGMLLHGASVPSCPAGSRPHGRGILRLLVDDPRPVRLARMAEHPAAVGLPADHEPMEAFLGVPIQRRGEVIGNLYLTEKRDGRTFTDADLEVAVALAAVSAVAVDNARLLARTASRERWARATADALALAASRGWSTAGRAELARLLATRLGAHQRQVRPGTGETTRVLTPEELADRGLDPARDEGVVVVVTAGQEAGWGVELTWAGVRSPLRQVPLDQARALGRRLAQAWLQHRQQVQQERIAVLEDRDRIARDLHDQVVQRLFATGLSVQAASTAVPGPVRHRLEGVVDDLDETIREIRSTIFELHAGPVAAALPQRLHELAGQGAEARGHRADVLVRGDTGRLGDDLAREVLAVARECLANVTRHARASRSSVVLDVAHDRVALAVTDDGVGLGDSTRRSGLANLADRARSRGGGLDLGPGPGGSGTRVRWWAPFDAAGSVASGYGRSEHRPPSRRRPHR